MREHPILFSAPMVRAILDGRKTQTRRVITPRSSTVDGYGWSDHGWGTLDFAGEVHLDGDPRRATAMGNGRYLKVPRRACECGCSIGDTRHRVRSRKEPGDRLWVKETFCPMGPSRPAGYWTDPKWKGRECFYAADNDRPTWAGPWKPSIFMPRLRSRLTLEVTGVRVERVQEISPEDAEAEGIPTHVVEHTFRKCYRGAAERAAKRVEYFRALWDSINGIPGHTWADNPWVWAYEFRRLP